MDKLHKAIQMEGRVCDKNKYDDNARAGSDNGCIFSLVDVTCDDD